MPESQVQGVLKSIAMGRNRFLYGLDQVPDDRLHWSPGGEAPSPLQLAEKTAVFLQAFAHVLQHGTWPQGLSFSSGPPADREAAKAALEGAFASLRQVIVNLSEADLAAPITLEWGRAPDGVVLELPLREMVAATPSVIGYHQGQLNLLQVIWGDTRANIPPNWGKEEI
jgi:DinB family protein